MKKLDFFFLFILFFCFSPQVKAQRSVFLFDQFVDTKIKMKPRGVTMAKANYDAANKRLLYKDGENTMEMTNTSAIDTVFFGKRKFVPGKNKVFGNASSTLENVFYEVVSLQHGLIYIDWHIRDVEIGKKGALGSITSGTVQTLQRADFDLRSEQYTAYDLQEGNVNAVYRKKSDNAYIFTYKNQTCKVKNLKQLLKIFSGHEVEIQTYVKEKNLDMKFSDESMDLINYCLGIE